MGNFIAVFILAVVQGITEWLPISSSGHITLTEVLLGYKGGLLLQVALHFGTLMAIFVYFGRDITNIFEDFLKFKWKSENGKMAWLIAVASIPAVVLGFFLKDFFDLYFSNLWLVALGFAITGVFLIIASIYKPSLGHEIGFSKAFVIGIAQALAIVPGISRAGSTMASGLLLGLKEKQAMRFSFLMAVPVIFGANLLTIGNQHISSELIWATLVCFAVALGVIHLMYKYVLVKRKNFMWFGVYCLILSLFLGAWLAYN